MSQGRGRDRTRDTKMRKLLLAAMFLIHCAPPPHFIGIGVWQTQSGTEWEGQLTIDDGNTARIQTRTVHAATGRCFETEATSFWEMMNDTMYVTYQNERIALLISTQKDAQGNTRPVLIPVLKLRRKDRPLSYLYFKTNPTMPMHNNWHTLKCKGQ